MKLPTPPITDREEAALRVLWDAVASGRVGDTSGRLVAEDFARLRVRLLVVLRYHAKPRHRRATP